MTDEQKKPLGDDEYQFPHDEYVSTDSDVHLAGESTEPAPGEEGPVTSRKPSRFSAIKEMVANLSQFRNKRVLFVVAAVLLFLIVVPILRSCNSSTPDQVEKPPVVEQRSPVVEVSRPVNTNLGSLDDLKETSSRAELKIQDLQAQMATMQSGIDEVKQANQQLTQTVTALSGQVKDLTTQLAQTLIQLRAGNARLPRAAFHLRAIVPDRAWIMSSTGETRSVTVGDMIKQYGTVSDIDSKQGVVYTSSGRKIEYGPNDY